MKQRGDDAEAIAASYLETQGLTLINRNYRCRSGEIDLIMRQGDTIVFVEVRMRSHSAFGGAAASITASKQQKLIRTAEHFLQQHGNTACRFDAILMTKLDTNQIEWIKNAFSA
ncbi:YraN family protein [Methylobacillus arboreus]|uniref:YraN family protein n=1 Tax=Methylobacillus arboreus TaxID=755170 RepID=UPI001E4EB9E7|nr:YraN family protein [Methylobacillus arboreus]MCB5190484.1 YraN family protein [Methylobacillus arboreus]